MAMNQSIILHEVGKDPHFKIWHAAEMHMFLYTYSDGGNIVCSEKVYPIRSGALCFVGAGKYHYTMPDEPEYYERSKIFIYPEDLSKIQKVFPDLIAFQKYSDGGFVYSRIRQDDQPEVERIFRTVEQCQNDPHSNAMLLSCCIQLMILMEQNLEENIIPESGIIHQAIAYINSNIFREISISEVCEAVHISKYHFCRQFRQSTGMTVMEYILKTRIILAKNLLLSEKISVSEVSRKCGFSSTSYFCRAFKENTGVTPLAFRKEHLSIKQKPFA